MLKNTSAWLKILDEAKCSAPWIRDTIKNQALNMLDDTFMDSDKDRPGKFRGFNYDSWNQLKQAKLDNHDGMKRYPEVTKKILKSRVENKTLIKFEKKPKNLVINPANIINPNSEKPIFVIDLKINKMTKKLGAKLDTLQKVLPLLCDAKCFFKEDVSGCYDQVRITDESRMACGFEFDGEYYASTCLVFGWSPAPFAIMALLGQLTRVCRNRGMELAHYIGKSNFESCFRFHKKFGFYFIR